MTTTRRCDFCGRVGIKSGKCGDCARTLRDIAKDKRRSAEELEKFALTGGHWVNDGGIQRWVWNK